MYFITATDTGVGKTFFSKKLIELAANQIDRREIAYYKPIQCGKDRRELFGNIFYETDYQCIERSCPDIDTYCTYEFDCAASPDYASSLENIKIDINKILYDFEGLKQNYKFIIVEGAGGLAVPINSTEMISDVTKALNLPIVIISKPVLGTINQTLLSIEHAKAKGLNIHSLILAEEDSISEAMEEEQLKASMESIERFSGIEFRTVAEVVQSFIAKRV